MDQAADTPDGKVVVELRSVYKDFHDVKVLKDFSLTITEGEFLSFLGPSGCGKTTCLRILAGFEEPTSGEVWIDGKNMDGIPPNKRDVSMVFQDYSLFPHMSVFENVAFGLRERREKKEVIRKKVTEALELVQLSGFEERKPRQLSGGQKQRVAIARSLVLNPKVLLLDEPLGALDLKLRKQMQTELKALQNKLRKTFVYVTHDQEEALTMSSRIVVLDRGAIQQVGNPFEIYNNPKSRFVADFIGEATFLEGYVEDVSTVESTVNLHGLRIKVSPVGLEKSSSVVVSIRPENVRFLGPSDSLKNELPGRITSSTYRGANVEYRIRLDNGKELRSIAPGRGILYPSGEPVRVGWDLEDGVVIRS